MIEENAHAVRVVGQLDKELQTRIELARLHLSYLETGLTGRGIPGDLLNTIEYEIYEVGRVLERASNRLMDYLGGRCNNQK